MAVNQYRKIQRPKGTTVITLGKAVPSDWRIVRLHEARIIKNEKGEFLIVVLQRVV